MSKTLLIATQNQGKLAEYRDLLSAMQMQVVGLADIGLGTLDVAETGDTFEANAEIKARAYGQASNLLVLADDSGLVVDALNGAPGVYTARYGGPGLDDAGRRAYLLQQMQGVPQAQRGARFVCVLALYDRQRDMLRMVRGDCEGEILTEERDAGYGFGYDPVFMARGYDKSMAQLLPEVKHRISHRGRAAAQLPEILKDFM